MDTSVGHTLKRTAGIVAVLLLISISFAAQAAAWCGNKVTATWDDIIKDTFSDSKLIDALVKEALTGPEIVMSVAEAEEKNVRRISTPETTVFRYVMHPGDYIADSSILSDFFPGELDIFVFILVGNGTWYMEIKDC